MLYYTNFTKDDITKITYANYDAIDHSFRYKKKHEYISSDLALLVEQAKHLPILNRQSDIGSIMDEMKEELREYDIDNFKPKDLTATKEMTFWKCPQFAVISKLFCTPIFYRCFVRASTLWTFPKCHLFCSR